MEESSTASLVVKNNNFGCLFLKEHKYNIAFCYFEKAIQEYFSLRVEDQSSKILYDMLFNSAFSLLKCNQFEDAFSIFDELSMSEHYSSNTTVWMRLSDCCIGKYMVENKGESILSEFGNEKQIDTVTKHLRKQPSTSSSCTLVCAFKCLKNSLFLIDRRLAETDMSPSSLHTETNDNARKVVVLMQLSYVCLCTSNATEALIYATDALSLLTTQLSSATNATSRKIRNHMFIAEMYRLEAQCELGGTHLTDVEQQLHTFLKLLQLPQNELEMSSELLVGTVSKHWFNVDVSRDSSNVPFSTGGTGAGLSLVDDKVLKSVKRAVILVNSAIVLCCSPELNVSVVGDRANSTNSTANATVPSLVKALELLVEALQICPSFTPALRMLIYVYLRQHRYDKAVELVRAVTRTGNGSYST